MKLSCLHETLSTGAVAFRPAALGQRAFGGPGEPRKAQGEAGGSKWYLKFAKTPRATMTEGKGPAKCGLCGTAAMDIVPAGQIPADWIVDGRLGPVCHYCAVGAGLKASRPSMHEDAAKGHMTAPRQPKTKVWQSFKTKPGGEKGSMTSTSNIKKQYADPHAANHPDERLLPNFRGKGL